MLKPIIITENLEETNPLAIKLRETFDIWGEKIYRWVWKLLRLFSFIIGLTRVKISYLVRIPLLSVVISMVFSLRMKIRKSTTLFPQLPTSSRLQSQLDKMLLQWRVPILKFVFSKLEMLTKQLLHLSTPLMVLLKSPVKYKWPFDLTWFLILNKLFIWTFRQGVSNLE